MTLKKIFISGLLAVAVSFSASAVELGYALGFSGGFQNNFSHNFLINPPLPTTRDISWQMSGFVGLGAVFGETLTHTVGFGWTGQLKKVNLALVWV